MVNGDSCCAALDNGVINTRAPISLSTRLEYDTPRAYRAGECVPSRRKGVHSRAHKLRDWAVRYLPDAHELWERVTAARPHRTALQNDQCGVHVELQQQVSVSGRGSSAAGARFNANPGNARVLGGKAQRQIGSSSDCGGVKNALTEVHAIAAIA